MNAGRLSGFVFSLVMVASLGCRHAELVIQYQPLAPTAATHFANVALRIVDARQADQGGLDKVRVGTFRGSWGQPVRIADTFFDVAPRTVGDATADALRGAGVGVWAAPKTLVGTITEYWMDGFVGYGCRINVVYQLFDAAGRVLWAVQLRGGSGGLGVPPGMHGNTYSPGTNPKTLAGKLFTAALADLALQARLQFGSPGFQQALLL